MQKSKKFSVTENRGSTDMSTPMTTDRGERSQSLERGLAVIQAFSDHAPRMTLSEAAKRTGLGPAPVRRFLHTLVDLGFVGTDGKMFWLLPPILRLGYAYLSSQDWLELAAPHVHRVAQAVGESCSASVLDGPDIVYVMRAASSRLLAFNVPVGRRLPAFCTSMGRVLLSGLPDNELREFLTSYPRPAYTPSTVTDVPTLLKTIRSVRNQQFAYIDQQFEPGPRSISVPIFAGGKLLAALNVAANAARTKKSDFTQRFLPILRQAADAISRDIEMQSSLTRTPGGAPLA